MLRRMRSAMAVDWWGFGYAALVASGGVLGYVKAGSVPSLAAGLLFGSAAGIGAYQITQNPQNIWLSLNAFLFSSCFRGTDWNNGNEILQFKEVHASWFSCRTKHSDAWKTWKKTVG
ncbi:transmembrane protein 14C-like isoform X3 [Narcine bancroftii]|uniref:transmembrane protein 14C-like isoform X3 n=1 Tax=Narcine bancroftii TaxID=1343680 RepID=UPI0038311197